MSLAANKINEDALNILQTKGGLVLAAMVMKAQPKSKQSSPLIIEPEVKTVIYFHSSNINDLDTWQMHTSEVLARTTFDDITVRGIPKEKLLTSMKGRTFHEMQDHLHKQAN